jgi:hypothetical protein
MSVGCVFGILVPRCSCEWLVLSVRPVPLPCALCLGIFWVRPGFVPFCCSGSLLPQIDGSQRPRGLPVLYLLLDQTLFWFLVCLSGFLDFWLCFMVSLAETSADASARASDALDTFLLQTESK